MPSNKLSGKPCRNTKKTCPSKYRDSHIREHREVVLYPRESERKLLKSQKLKLQKRLLQLNLLLYLLRLIPQLLLLKYLLQLLSQPSPLSLRLSSLLNLR